MAEKDEHGKGEEGRLVRLQHKGQTRPLQQAPTQPRHKDPLRAVRIGKIRFSPLPDQRTLARVHLFPQQPLSPFATTPHSTK